MTSTCLHDNEYVCSCYPCTKLDIHVLTCAIMGIFFLVVTSYLKRVATTVEMHIYDLFSPTPRYCVTKWVYHRHVYRNLGSGQCSLQHAAHMNNCPGQMIIQNCVKFWGPQEFTHIVHQVWGEICSQLDKKALGTPKNGMTSSTRILAIMDGLLVGQWVYKWPLC